MREPTPTTTPADHADRVGGTLTAGAAAASWHGVLRRDGRQVWSCGHHHATRTHARACAEQERAVPGAPGLGRRLRELRRAAGVTMRQAAQALECSEAKVSRIENGKGRANPRDVRDMLVLYGVGGPAREALLQTARAVWRLRRRGGAASPPTHAPEEPGR